ncbi:MAG TPA: hypothetical protein VGK90_00195 [Rhizomicrobium sp.]|jgi:outer membrane protein assembly factor BamB
MSISGSVARAAAVIALSLVIAGGASAKKFDITTYHYDNFRTGWNSQEKSLTPAAVGSAKFQMLASTALDDQVDAQPLILTQQTIKGKGTHDVVYIATESNSVYAIDANSGEILRQTNLGAPVPRDSLPGECTNGGPNLGINSTPAIDPTTHTIYLIAYVYKKSKPYYYVHALDPSSLADTVKPVEITAQSQLSDGTTYVFDPHEARNRAGLLLANGNLYAGFASFCDYDANLSRGWILGWNASTLSPLAANDLTNQTAHSTNDFFLSTIWMSGFGLAASSAGDVYFITGNSDYAGNSYNPPINIEESVVQMSPDLSKIEHLFTPMGSQSGWQYLDEIDGDFGSGGFMILPPQKGQPSDLAVATGKAGIMYVFNADDVSNGKKKGGKAYSSVDPGPCWCGPSYYMGSDGTARIVSSSAYTVDVWKLKAEGKPGLTLDNSPGNVEDTVYFPGFFTSVSSNGTKPSSTVIWAVGRPVDFDQELLKIHAYDPEQGKQIFVADAGYWTNSLGDSNTVPVVANGKVYVATVKSLAIFGLAKTGQAQAKLPPPPKIVRPQLAAGEHEVRGIVRRMSGYTLVVQTKQDKLIAVDYARAAANYKVAAPSIGHGVLVRGTFEGKVLKARVVGHAPDHPRQWPLDR